MSRTLEVLTKIYKPYRITKVNNCLIMKTMEGDYVVKEKIDVNYRELYNYLLSRSFSFFPKIVSDEREDVVVFEYVEDVCLDKEQKALDLIKLVALLHSKTTYFKEVTKDKYKEIYDNLRGNIGYIQDVYDKRFNQYILEEYNLPSHYLFLRNYSLILNACRYSLDKLDSWYDMVKENTKQRVCLVHNNLSLEHYLKNEDDYLISWDKYIIDTPVMDLYKFYRNEWDNTQFSILFETYDKEHGLLDDEKILLDIMISIPFLVEEEGNEYNNCRGYRKLINYLGKSSKVIFND